MWRVRAYAFVLRDKFQIGSRSTMARFLSRLTRLCRASIALILKSKNPYRCLGFSTMAANG